MSISTAMKKIRDTQKQRAEMQQLRRLTRTRVKPNKKKDWAPSE